VLVYATSPITRAGLAHLLGTMARIEEASQPGALRRALAHGHYHALVAAASDGATALAITQPYALPVIFVAPTDATLPLPTAHVVGVIRENDPAAPVYLQHVLAAIQDGDWDTLPFTPAMPTASRGVVPPAVMQQFAHTPLTPREIETLWLDLQGWSRDQIAEQLSIEQTTVNSHWKRIQRKLHLTRQDVRLWARAQVAHPPHGDQQERAVGE
jgi:DNA-binding NarL/FixJ family response regulator